MIGRLIFYTTMNWIPSKLEMEKEWVIPFDHLLSIVQGLRKFRVFRVFRVIQRQITINRDYFVFRVFRVIKNMI